MVKAFDNEKEFEDILQGGGTPAGRFPARSGKHKRKNAKSSIH